MTAKHLLWGKAANAGETCVAPDYIIIEQYFQDKFVAALQDVYIILPILSRQSISSGTIVSTDFSAGVYSAWLSRVVLGGDMDEATKYIDPTVVKDVLPDDCSERSMSEEIFGPILLIMPVDSIDKGLAYYVYAQ
ncbi:Aldehyde/histidinol dehydrogenase [Lentinula raphanica]|uniref:Aldehyde/histidinol dehydrogenase n=1 Tax=Lentinula raphanica TaxID=153919 RepID=A0AA38PIM5_9AGAR|nr:Aldehyde/histidinol dehydrogenase [Lentinula raphanica]KAJ3843618.1 Aldehyde/histidinol dehydrogenase [Lentinula raphanica]